MTRTINRVANLTAAIFYFAVHVICIVAALAAVWHSDTASIVLFAAGAIITYRPYKQAAERAQRSIGTEHNYTYTKQHNAQKVS